MTTAAPPARLGAFPVSFFSMVMGLSGLTIVAHRAATGLGGGAVVGQALFGLTLALFLLLAGLYLAKMVRHFDAVAAEWRHPVRISFFPTITIGLILLGTAAQPVDPLLARLLWSAGAGGHLVMTLAVMRSWIGYTHYDITHFNPAWFIPVVGNILVPIAGIHLAPADLSWFFFAIGLLFWLVLMTIAFYRLIFHPPLPGKLVPTLFILLAPPSAGFLAWVAINDGAIDPFARLLYFGALFLFLLLLTQLPTFTRQRFTLSWWAYSFPLAAFAAATLTMGSLHETYRLAGLGLAAVLAVLIAGLTLRTLVAVTRGEICQPES
ncbi:SLAC1 anion channel family protein [Phaeospirillum tilakii]|uniref:SLAC1 anion channel family protein n=1 Tax=Phaeospirillum tilakii TaxID=741673 RepID=A0ABW5CCI0_9PROT